MSLPRAPEKYEQRWATEVLRQLDQRDLATFNKGSDIELGQDERIIMRSPNGTRWAIAVDDAGVLFTTAL